MSNAQAAHACPTLGRCRAPSTQKHLKSSANAAALDLILAGKPTRAISIVNLVDIVEMAVAFNRNAARGRGVRLHCYSLDQLPVQGEEYALLDALDCLIGSAVRDALWGSLVVCEAGLSTDEIVVHIRYARPVSGCDAASCEIAWTDLIRAWPRGEQPQDTDTWQGGEHGRLATVPA